MNTRRGQRGCGQEVGNLVLATQTMSFCTVVKLASEFQPVNIGFWKMQICVQMSSANLMGTLKDCAGACVASPPRRLSLSVTLSQLSCKKEIGSHNHDSRVSWKKLVKSLSWTSFVGRA